VKRIDDELNDERSRKRPHRPQESRSRNQAAQRSNHAIAPASAAPFDRRSRLERSQFDRCRQQDRADFLSLA
jgi:hypothetical protein